MVPRANRPFDCSFFVIGGFMKEKVEQIKTEVLNKLIILKI